MIWKNKRQKFQVKRTFLRLYRIVQPTTERHFDLLNSFKPRFLRFQQEPGIKECPSSKRSRDNIWSEDEEAKQGYGVKCPTKSYGLLFLLPSRYFGGEGVWSYGRPLHSLRLQPRSPTDADVGIVPRADTLAHHSHRVNKHRPSRVWGSEQSRNTRLPLRLADKAKDERGGGKVV